jgi:hypothetical protein
MGAAKPLDAEIFFYISHLNNAQKKAVLSVVKTMANTEEDWWEEVEMEAAPSIHKALKEMKDQKLSSHNEVMKKYKKWLLK